MTRTLWLIFIFGLSASLIWWPGAKNEATIEALIQKERAWQEEHLGFDLVEKTDEWLTSIQHLAARTSLPHGPESSLSYRSSALGEDEFLAAHERVSQKPYFQALFALLVLSIGRVIVTILLALLLSPVAGALVIDALCAREIRATRFGFPDPFRFRLAGTALILALEGLFLISLVPLWIPPAVILGFFLFTGLCVYILARDFYR